MKSVAGKFLLTFLLFVLLSMTSCSVFEKYTSFVFKRESEDVAMKEITSHETEIKDENDVVFYEEKTETIAVDIPNYEEPDVEVVTDDVVGSAYSDSLEMALQERIDKENSGEAIVEESDAMMDMIEDLEDMPYFEKNKLESSSKSENIYGYTADFIPSFPDSVYAERIEKLRHKLLSHWFTISM